MSPADAPAGYRPDYGLVLQAANLPADPVPLPAAGAGGQVEGGRSVITGGNLVNNSTSAATVTLLDGQDAKGGVIAVLNVPASSALPFTLPNKGVMAEMGVFVQVAGGNVTGTIYVVHLWRYKFTPLTD